MVNSLDVDRLEFILSNCPFQLLVLNPVGFKFFHGPVTGNTPTRSDSS